MPDKVGHRLKLIPFDVPCFFALCLKIWAEAGRFYGHKRRIKHPWLTQWSMHGFFPPLFSCISVRNDACFLNHWQPWGAIGCFIWNPFELLLPLMNIECCGSANLPLWNKERHWLLQAFPFQKFPFQFTANAARDASSCSPCCIVRSYVLCMACSFRFFVLFVPQGKGAGSWKAAHMVERCAYADRPFCLLWLFYFWSFFHSDLTLKTLFSTADIWRCVIILEFSFSMGMSPAVFVYGKCE